MKKLLFISIVSLLAMSCNMKPKEEANTNMNADMKALYEQNLAIVKNCISDFENKNLTDFASNVSDSVIWHSPAYGDSVTTKAHWMDMLKGFNDGWESQTLNGAIFLPGLDSASHEMDGSVRFYGSWDGVNKTTHQLTKSNFYGSYEFNKDHKVTEADEFFDVGGLMNAVQAKK